MLNRFNDSDRQMLVRLIRDPRTDQLSLAEHRLLAIQLQRNLLRPIIAIARCTSIIAVRFR